MGNGLFLRLKNWTPFRNKETRVIMFGLEGSGKTTILYYMKLGVTSESSLVSTIGFNVEDVKYKGDNYTVWDIGGSSKMRNIWNQYYQNTDTDVVVFVVDSNDHERMPTCREELQKMLSTEDLSGCIFLILANKQDLPNAMTIAEITETLGLKAYSGRLWSVQGTCALSGVGVNEALDWVEEMLKRRRKRRWRRSL